MSHPLTLNEALFNEAFNIISLNQTKTNSLRQSLLKDLSYNEEANSKVIEFLGEVEYDLNNLHGILKDLKFSYQDMHNSLLKNTPCLNEPINEGLTEEKTTLGKTYSITTEKYGNSNSQNNFYKINDYYINSPINKDIFDGMQRSTSCKSYHLNKDENKFNKIKLIKNKYYYRNNDELNLLNGKTSKLNFDYDAYFTDNTLNKTSKNSYTSYFDFLKRNNKNENSPNFNKEQNEKENLDINENNEINDNNIKNENNNIFTFSEQKNKNIELNENNYNPINNKINLDYSIPNEQEINEMNQYIVDNNIPLTYEFHHKDKEEEEFEKQKREIIKNIISEIFQDTNKLNLLKKALGEDIGEKLLSGNINERELYKVVQILKKHQEDNLKKKKHFKKRKFNTPSDKLLLKEKLKNNRYNYREFPRGWSSTKDYFINNGTNLVKDKRHKK